MAKTFCLLLAFAASCAVAQSTPPLTVVNATTQAGRDDERLRILDRELKTEEAALELSKSPAERERRGADIAALKREIELTARQSGAIPTASTSKAERRQKPAEHSADVPPALSRVLLVLPKRPQPQEIVP